MADETADDLIRRLGLRPHPEGGHYRETYRAPAPPGGTRGAVTAIHFLLRAGERSHWHRVDAVEIWHWYAGAALELSIAADGAAARASILGTDFAAGHVPQIAVPAHAWQAARSLGDWTLVGCTVSPAFEFAGFTLAPPGWEPPG
ncbi:MAG: cupin domain-containing protein [Rhodospirillales bacterium]|nr:MAG: cupin domain-containing protein [Rhodospirillales bacterium]